MCQSHTGRLTGLWFLSKPAFGLNTNDDDDETKVTSYDFDIGDDGQLPSSVYEALYILGLPFGHYQTEFVLIRGKNHENVICFQDKPYQGNVFSDDQTSA